MVNVIRIADAVQQIEEIADGSDDIRRRNMFYVFIHFGVADDIDDFSSSSGAKILMD